MFRFITVASLLLLLFLSVPASGMKSRLFPLPADTVAPAADLLRSKDYTGAARLAKAAPAGGARDFIAGVASYRAKEWEEASNHLQAAAKSFPILADYALYFQARSLNALKRYDDALIPLQELLKLYPDTPVKRQAMILLADTLYEQNNFKAATSAYQKFIETYPSGSDALNAQYRIALCREALGEPASAAKILRTLWLTSPASTQAAAAKDDLKRLTAAGSPPETYTGEELFRRASTLLDLKKYSQAVTAFKDIPRSGQSKEFINRLDLKYGQAVYRSRNYRDAEDIFAKTAATTKNPAQAAEAVYWIARCRDKCDRHEEAVKTFLQVPDRWPKANEADNAILEAALITKSDQQWSETLSLLQRLLKEYPDSNLKKQAWWEAGWSGYKLRDLQTAGYYFAKLAECDPNRDRALYWLSRVRALSGDGQGAQAAYATLLRDFPMSFYALANTGGDENRDPGHPDKAKLPAITGDTLETLPLPVNNDRIKALITFGLYEEARKELTIAKAKTTDVVKLLGIARLYLEMEDYNGAYNLVGRDPGKFAAKDLRQTLALQFPRPFQESAAKHAGSNNLPLALVYAVIKAESSFSPAAVSPAGAVGLMQLMPSTAAMLEGAGRKTLPLERLKEPELNIGFGTRHMKDLITQYNTNIVAVIASYNAGGGTVNRWLQRFGTLPADEFIEQIPYGETRDYVKKVLTSAAIYARLYGMDLNGLSLPLPATPFNPS
ncbi:soluble lytic murein transglycosylase [Geobacter sp. OR-1]|uniref:lytic transglycosylase domain-containing protein n=1 Tax=Geobacter sp. OR-1 TaxID=1266765 RepID=UPI000542C695|nr:transglycosylase SLT domain-containing protein [Geobacter sp. OR-1]GAM11507.1 soluble lytic murein transglycosylase [Geobacter sp. OR-1]